MVRAEPRPRRAISPSAHVLGGFETISVEVIFRPGHLAVLRRDGFVSLDGGSSGGEILTKPLLLTGKRLFLNLDASTAGRAIVELVGEDGKPIPGFTATVSGNAVRLPVRFKSGATLETLAGRTVRMKLGLRDARLYAFWTE